MAGEDRAGQGLDRERQVGDLRGDGCGVDELVVVRVRVERSPRTLAVLSVVPRPPEWGVPGGSTRTVTRTCAEAPLARAPGELYGPIPVTSMLPWASIAIPEAEARADSRVWVEPDRKVE